MKPLLAVTGGIGSGKSYVVKIFSALGAPVYDADSRTKELYGENRELLSSLVSLLGNGILKNGVLDRGCMAEKIFNDSGLLKKTEEIVYPFVLDDLEKWRAAHEDDDAAFLIMESAVYLEKEILKGVADKVLTISCPAEIRISRAMKRSGISREKVEERIRNQRTDAFRESLADFAMLSDFKHPLLPQVLEVCKAMENMQDDTKPF